MGEVESTTSQSNALSLPEVFSITTEVDGSLLGSFDTVVTRASDRFDAIAATITPDMMDPYSYGNFLLQKKLVETYRKDAKATTIQFPDNPFVRTEMLTGYTKMINDFVQNTPTLIPYLFEGYAKSLPLVVQKEGGPALLEEAQKTNNSDIISFFGDSGSHLFLIAVETLADKEPQYTKDYGNITTLDLENLLGDMMEQYIDTKDTKKRQDILMNPLKRKTSKYRYNIS